MKNTPRRNFLKRLAAIASGSVIVANTGYSLTNKKTMKDKIVKNIKALGFQWETRDPFLFCVHHEDFFPVGNGEMAPDPKLLKGRRLGQDFIVKDGWRMYHGQKIPGFPSHPHRGFETVTVVRKGVVDHSDSLGAAGRYGNGDTQWMTAGKGVQHAEMFPLIHDDKENTMELFQIWLNLPKTKKFSEPHFKMFWNKTIPKITQTDSEGRQTLIELIAGELNENKAPEPPPDSWANNNENHVAIWNIHIEKGGKWILPKTKADINRTIYFYNGKQIKVAGTIIKNYHSAEIKPDEDVLIESIEDNCRILLLQGKPINEPVVQHGPFVMNTRQEIQQAFADYQQTQFGGWPWKVNDPVHSKEKGRFALHADGRMEEPDQK